MAGCPSASHERAAWGQHAVGPVAIDYYSQGYSAALRLSCRCLYSCTQSLLLTVLHPSFNQNYVNHL